MKDLSDEELVERYRSEQGSPTGRSLLNELFQRHRDRVATWCYRLTGEVDAAADLAQDVLLKAFQRLDSFRGQAKFTTWLYSIARNHCMDELRSRATRPDQSEGIATEEIADMTSEDFPTALERRESEAWVRQLMRETLDATEIRVMTLHFVQELPLDAITRLMGLTNQSGSKAYIVSGKRKLSRAFEKWRRSQRLRGEEGYGR